MIRTIVLIILCFLAGHILPSYAVATGEFTADYAVDYAVAPSGITIVTKNVKLTNNLSNLYPKEYTILIDSDKINNIIAYDGKGIIQPQIIQSDRKTEISLVFNEHVVGVGKSVYFTLRFESSEVAQRNGNIWEIQIPPVIVDPDVGNYDVSLQVPPTFGSNAYLTPLPANGNKWNKEQMVSGGISAAYGENQFFSLGLSYFLDNTTSSAMQTEIALPPDTAFQKVSIVSIDPKPSSVVRDSDGNWLALFDLEPNSSIDVSTMLTVSVSLKPRNDFREEIIDASEYLQAQPYWETTDPQIQELARTLRTPKSIYDYVVNTLTYDYNRINQNPLRKGALGALANPSNAICMEFTDLFVTLARAAGIPAREAVGYAYTTNTKLRPLSLVSDVLHAWPEYYDAEKQLWIPVDPTWEDTTGGINYFDKLDYNHIVFAIHGLKSDYPYPAGFYRRSATGGKVVDVQFADPSSRHLVGKLTTSIDFPSVALTGLVTSGTVTIENTSGVGINDVLVEITSVPRSLGITRTERHIPPLTKITIPITYRTANFIESGGGKIIAVVNGEVQQQLFTIHPIYLYVLPLFIVTVGGIIYFVIRRK